MAAGSSSSTGGAGIGTARVSSHFIWRDPSRMMAWAWYPSKGDRFYLYKDKTDQVEAVGPDAMTVNGHCT